jgi:hypothetical protein
VPKALRIIGQGWIWLSAALIAVSVISHVVLAPTIWDGISDVQGWFSPFNFFNWIAVVILLSPGLGLLMLAEKIEKRRGEAARQVPGIRPKTIILREVLAFTAILAWVPVVGLLLVLAIRAVGPDAAVGPDQEKWVEGIVAKDRPWRVQICTDYWITAACGGKSGKGFDDPGTLPAVIHVGDMIKYTDMEGKERTFTVRNISVFTYEKDIDTVYQGQRLTTRKGDTSCILYEERSRRTISADDGAYLSTIAVKGCSVPTEAQR